MKKWNIGNLWKKYKYVGLVVLAGIVLMVLPAGWRLPGGTVCPIPAA